MLENDMMNMNIYGLREIKESDKELLLKWANDSTVRENAFHQEQISYDEHERWFKNVLKDENTILYILMKEKKPIGQCRLDIDEEGIAEIDYSIDKIYRGKGLGKLLIKLVIQEIKESHPEIRKLIGKVKAANFASSKCFLSNGFIDSYHVYELKV